MRKFSVGKFTIWELRHFPQLDWRMGNSAWGNSQQAEVVPLLKLDWCIGKFSYMGTWRHF